MVLRLLLLDLNHNELLLQKFLIWRKTILKYLFFLLLWFVRGNLQLFACLHYFIIIKESGLQPERWIWSFTTSFIANWTHFGLGCWYKMSSFCVFPRNTWSSLARSLWYHPVAVHYSVEVSSRVCSLNICMFNLGSAYAYVWAIEGICSPLNNNYHLIKKHKIGSPIC